MTDLERLQKALSDHPGPHHGEEIVPIFEAAFDVAFGPTKSALDLMRSLSINPLIPDGLRALMKDALAKVDA